MAVSPDPDVLEVGYGTGTVARQFQAAGCTVLGVEPDARMDGYARNTGVDVEVARFEDREPAGRSFDAVVSGTAWHWIDPVEGAATAERVLRPHGRLAVFWHTCRLPAEVSGAFVEAFTRVVPDSPVDVRSTGTGVDAYQALFTRAADGRREASPNRSSGDSTGNAPTARTNGWTSYAPLAL